MPGDRRHVRCGDAGWELALREPGSLAAARGGPPADGTLAGSALTLDRAIRNAIRFANFSLEDALSLVTANPAHVLGIGGERGILAVGATADLVLLDPDLTVGATLRAGEIIFS